MISVVIPTLDAADKLPQTLQALLDANRQGLIREVIISDGGSTDATLEIAAMAGARIVHGSKGRGEQLKTGAATARGEWLLFLHADTVLSPGWEDIATEFAASSYDRQAAAFNLAFDRTGWQPKIVAAFANMRAHLARLPYGDQALLISRQHYDRIDGYRAIPLFEDVDIVRKIVADGGRRALKILPAKAITCAERYSRDGYFARVIRNARCLMKYFSGQAPETIVEFYYGHRTHRSPRHDGQASARGAGQDTSGT